jgi:5-methylcytosine-specific restriction endonuclease McrA
VDVLNRPVLVFSKSYMPINRITVKRALVLLVSGRAEPLDFGQGEGVAVHSPTAVFTVPSTIRLTMNHIQRAWRVPAVSRREVLKRDKHTCQYCGSNKQLTLDHIIPRSKGGPHSWTNVVTACARCNSRKGDRTPTQAGMTLRSQPKPPSHPLLAYADEFWKSQEAAKLKAPLA